MRIARRHVPPRRGRLQWPSPRRLRRPASPGGGFGGGGGGFAAPARPVGGFPPGPGGRDRSANFGPPAPPRRLRNAKKGQQQEHKPRGPIKERSGGRIYAVDDLEDDSAIEIDDVAVSASAEGVDEVPPVHDDENDDQNDDQE